VLWALFLYLIALLPQLGTDASERGLYFPMIPASILLACAASTVGGLVRKMVQKPVIYSRWTRIMGWGALLGVLVPGTLLSGAMPWMFLPSFKKPEKELRTLLPYLSERQPEHVVLLNTSGIFLTFYAWDTVNYLSDQPQDVWLLSSAQGVFSMERTGESSFIIHTDRPGWLNNLFTRLLRTNPKLKPGQRYETKIFSATLTEMTPKGSDVLSVRFDFKHPLKDPRWLFLYWNGQAFEPLDIQSLPMGETKELADTSDLWKAMY
jgi:hypothetical protein